VKIVVSGDWHLDHVTAGVERFDEVVAAMGRVFEAAEQSDLFIFLGDLCNPESPRAWRAVEYAVRWAGMLHTQQLWLTGNHDIVEDGCRSSTLSPLDAALDHGQGTVVVRKPMSIGVGPVRILCFPFVSRSVDYDPADVVRKLPPCGFPTVVVSHLSLLAAQPGSESEEMARGRGVFLPAKELRVANLDIVATLNGHYHRRQVVQEDGLEVQCVGSLARLTRGERDNSPAFVVVEV
jgi:DNA repair exonuclease SbcCD nuclease subunit